MRNRFPIILCLLFLMILHGLHELLARPWLNSAAQEQSQKASEAADSKELKLDSEKPIQFNADSLNQHIRQGKSYFNREDYVKAKSEFMFILSKDSKNIEAFNYLGRIYLGQQKYREAAIVFQQALKENPNNKIAKDGLRKINEYNKLKQLAQKTQRAINNNQWNEALRNLNQIAKVNPSFEAIKEFKQQIARHFYESGEEAEKLGDRSSAYKSYRRVKVLLPDYINIDQKIASLQSVDETITDIEKFYIQGIKAYQQRDWDKAIADLQQVVNRDKKYKDAADKLALARDKKYALISSGDTISTRKLALAETVKTIIPSTHSQTALSDSVSKRSGLKPFELIKNKISAAMKSSWYMLGGILAFVLLSAMVARRFINRNKDETAEALYLGKIYPKQKMPKESEPVELAPPDRSEAEALESTIESAAIKETIENIKLKTIKDSKSPIETQKILKRYELRKPISRIGNIKFYEAFDRRLNREVIIDKISLVGSQKNQPLIQSKLIKGAQDAAKLNHPNIIRVEDIFKEQDNVYIAMERVEGIDLEQLLKQEKRLALRRSAHIIVQICYALDYAHRKGIIHCDVRPANIKIMTNDFVKLSGFELSNIMQINELTPSGISKNDPCYMSPEQIKAGEIDLRTDIFTLGVVAFEMTTGQLPFKGEFISSTIYHILETTPEPPAVLNTDIPEEVSSIIMKMLEKEVHKRYFNALDIGLKLKKFI